MISVAVPYRSIIGMRLPVVANGIGNKARIGDRDRPNVIGAFAQDGRDRRIPSTATMLTLTRTRPETES